MSAPKNPAKLTGGDWYAVRRFTTFKTKPLEERFWEKVEKTATCWLWKAGLDEGGYDKFQHEGRTRRAHHVAWELAGKKIPKGKILRHTCDTPKCVRDEHLLLGTQKQNIRDAFERGRIPSRKVPVERRRYGERAARAMLTNEQAAEIRRRYVPRRGVGALADEFGIARSVLHDIVSGKTYKETL